mmetsp:Transcript_106815/g.297355  ORF Transcript_106815/g.297355 Transcript_106815/m.297355 type:complete len:354 (-) Transcript_106815:140-1201(-)
MGAVCCNNAGPDRVKVEVVNEEFAEDRVVEVTIVSAHAVRDEDSLPGSRAPDMYCLCEIPGKSGSKTRTMVCDNTLDPVWNHQFVMASYTDGDALMFTLFDKDTQRFPAHLARTQLSAARLVAGSFDGELPLAGEHTGVGAALKVRVARVPRPPRKRKPKIKSGLEPGALSPGGPRFQYRALVTREEEDQPLGLQLETLGDATELIGRVGDGALAAYNETAKEHETVRPGDVIIEVNGKTHEEMFDELRHAAELEILIARPTAKFQVQIVKNQTLGVKLKYYENGPFLVLSEINEGPIQEWNAANQDQEVKIDDRILSVNGTTGTSEELLKLVEGEDRLDLEIFRPYSLGTLP